MIPEQVKQIYAAFKKLLAEERPAIYKRLFAKRIVPPPGYCSNEHYKLSAASPFIIANVSMKAAYDRNNALAMYASCAMMLKYDFPTYYISPEFCEAVNATDPPEAMTLDGINWPMEAMLFMLPEQWTHDRMHKAIAPWVGIAHLEAGDMPLRDLNDHRSDFGGMPLLPVGSSHDRFIYTFTDYYKNDIGRWTSMEHDGVYQSAWPVSRIQSVDPNGR